MMRPEIELPPWLEGGWRRLAATLDAGRAAGALLLHGPSGIGKGMLAERFAAAVLCAGPRSAPCGGCRSCHLLGAGSHPDFRRIEPEEGGSGISIGSVRELIDDFTLAAEGARVAIVATAESMNQAAANAFLKTLEEPAGRVTFLLTSNAPGRLPATIRSRCRQVALPSPTAAEAHAWLEPAVGSALGGQLLALAGGSPFTALALLQRHGEETLAALHAETAGLLAGRADPLEVAERWRKTGDPQLVAQAVFAALGSAARSGAGDPDRLHAAVDDVLETRRQRLEVPGLAEQLMYEGLALRCAGAIAG